MVTNRIGIAFLISLAGHCLFFGILGININFPSRDKPRDTIVRIELERPPLLPEIDKMGEEKKLKQAAEKAAEPMPEEVVMENPLRDAVQEKIELIDPAKEAMLRYQDMVKQRIESARRYPLWAKRQGIEGTVYMNFKVLSNGLGRDIRIIGSSGSPVLDEEAIKTIKRANPFPPIPSKINQDLVSMDVAIVFVLD